MTDASHYKLPKEPGRWRAIMLATVVHAALFALLWFGVRWQNETPVAVEAEVWSPQPREAAPPPQPVPEPEKKPEPEPVVKEAPKPAVVQPPVVDPDIALAQEKKKRELEDKKKRLEEELLEKERQEKLQKIAEQKAEERRIEKEKTEIARKKAEADAAKQAAAEKAKRAAAEKARQQQLAADAEAAEEIRQEEIARMTKQAGAGGTGEAPKAQGGRADPGYTSRLSAKIKSNTTFVTPTGLDSNPAVEYTVDLLPDGSVRSIKKLRSSGLPGFDEAVERAIRRAEPYPADASGAVPSIFTFSHKPKDNR
jgi:colicin import membrane protein